MTESSGEQATRILDELRNGDASAAGRLLPLVYSELRAVAGALFVQQPPDHTLQPTALVHEAYIRLTRQRQPEWEDRAHFVAVAAKAMRNLMVDHARKRKAGKRGGGWERITLDGVIDAAARRSIDVLALEEALTELGALHERMASVVELRFFGGLTVSETAEALGVARSTAPAPLRCPAQGLSRGAGPGRRRPRCPRGQRARPGW
jgi:RNA polymerase sigma factor (TIGR02999 family)